VPPSAGRSATDRAAWASTRPACDGKSQSGAARLVGFRESVEQVRKNLGCDAWSPIDDREHDSVAPALTGDHDVATCRCVAQSVGDEVAEHLADPQRVELDQRQIIRRLDSQPHTGLGRQRLERGGDFLGEDREVGRLEMEGKGAGLRKGQRSEILGRARSAIRISSTAAGQMGFIGRVDAVDHRFELALQDRQRSAQLVADIGQ